MTIPFFTGEENPPPVCSVIDDSTVFGDAARENAVLIYRIMLSAAMCASTPYHKNLPADVSVSGLFVCLEKRIQITIYYAFSSSFTREVAPPS